MPPKKAVKRAPLVASNVSARVRPLASEGGHAEDGHTVFKELTSYTISSVIGEAAAITLTDSHGSVDYSFPRVVIEPTASQEALYTAAGVVDGVLKFCNESYNVLFFAYGQTGTGKTYVNVVEMCCKALISSCYAFSIIYNPSIKLIMILTYIFLFPLQVHNYRARGEL